ncbi:hypothetical protein ABW21_db0205588 [Orbilia brochopaga]|nr:hypothetical protein ABW21_db0205588 [Drechslerella brochopaga]
MAAVRAQTEATPDADATAITKYWPRLVMLACTHQNLLSDYQLPRSQYLCISSSQADTRRPCLAAEDRKKKARREAGNRQAGRTNMRPLSASLSARLNWPEYLTVAGCVPS